MAQPTFVTSGDTPRRTDTTWFRWLRILSQYQNRVGAIAANNPSRLDTLRIFKQKVLYALNRQPYSVTNAIPAGTQYNGSGVLFFGGLEPGSSYTVIFGANDAQMISLPSTTIVNPGVGIPTVFTMSNTGGVRFDSVGATPDLPVTATLYKN